MIVGIIIGAVVVIILLWALLSYNSLVKQQMDCKEAFSTMDVYLKKRFDLIPNLVSTVKGYAKHEAETLEKVVQARNASAGSTIEQRMEDENQISGALRQIFALSENYPDLKANANFMSLMEQLKLVEEDIANSRKYYNAIVNKYNISIMVVPKNIIAGMFNFKEKPLYEVDDATERQNVKVDFDN